jgi:hypothetical protein
MGRPYRWIRPPAAVVLLQRLTCRSLSPGKTSPLFPREAGFIRGASLSTSFFARARRARDAAPISQRGHVSRAFARHKGSNQQHFLDTWPPSFPPSATLPWQGGVRAWRPWVDGLLKESRSSRQLGVAGRHEEEREGGLGQAWAGTACAPASHGTRSPHGS